jgi:hypothetical protein
LAGIMDEQRLSELGSGDGIPPMRYRIGY